MISTKIFLSSVKYRLDKLSKVYSNDELRIVSFFIVALLVRGAMWLIGLIDRLHLLKNCWADLSEIWYVASVG